MATFREEDRGRPGWARGSRINHPIRTQWQGTIGALRHIACEMMERFSSRGRGGAGQAGLPGNRLLAAACLVSIMACPVAAKAPPEPGPTASASIRISVSVARRYGLATDGGSRIQGPEQPGGSPFCLASSGGEMLTPVLLITPSPGRADDNRPTAADKASRLLPCGSTSRTLLAADAPDGSGTVRTVIVSPE